jgi:adenine-specific DNA glycosylase
MAATGSERPTYPGDINQALIELGSTVCKVREPKCESCPLQAWCGAYHLCTGAKSEGTQVTFFRSDLFLSRREHLNLDHREILLQRSRT